MTVLADIGRYLAFVVLLYALFYAAAQTVRLAQVVYLRRRQTVQYLVAFLQSALWWVGIIVAIYPITGAINASLLLVLLLIPVVQLVLGLVMQRLLRVRAHEKSSIATAVELVAIRHPWSGGLAAKTSALMFPALLVCGLLVLIIDPGDAETVMFRLTFAVVFATALPSALRRALIMMSPVLDDNTRDQQLAGGITAMVTQLIALGLLLSSFDLPRTDIPLGIADVSLSVSLPILGIVVAYFLLATTVPYAIGARAARRLRKKFLDDERSVKDELKKLLLVPQADLYDPGLDAVRSNLDENLGRLKDEYFYLQFRRESPTGTADAIAEAMDAGELGASGALQEQQGSSPGTVELVSAAPAESSDQMHPGLSRRTERSDQASVVVEAESSETSVSETEDLTFGELARLIADEHGWAQNDVRRGSLEVLAHSLEHDARYVDPAFVHVAWLERVRDLVDRIQKDLGTRPTRVEKESTGQHWSRVADEQRFELEERAADPSGRPRAVVAVSAVGALLIPALIRAAATEVWDSFNAA